MRSASSFRNFGMRPAPVEQCRVLELGCGDGGNLIPMAYTLRGSEFVGVDLGARGIAIGQEMVAERAAAAGLPAERALALRHCIAAHHGADALPGRRFGSPEALALYRLNALDASVKGALEHGLPQ